MSGRQIVEDDDVVPGFTELSGVCTHPDAQGRGLGRLLSVFITQRVLARGDAMLAG